MHSLFSLRSENCPAYILAGGRSSRFGSDKARVEIGTEPLLLSLRRSLSQQGHSVEVVADRVDRYSDLGIQCVVDCQSDHGPLAGVASALQHRQQRQSGWLLLVSCDLYIWRNEWFMQLSHALHVPTTETRRLADDSVDSDHAGQCRSDLDAVAFAGHSLSGTHSWEPFPSLLHTRLLPKTYELLQLGKRSLQDLYRSERGVAISTHDNPQSWSFNTLEQLTALRIKPENIDL